jgi:beta-lactamase class A
VLDSTNRPKGSQRRLARKRLKAQADAARSRRELKPGSGPNGSGPRPNGTASGSKSRLSPNARPERGRGQTGAQSGNLQSGHLQSGNLQPGNRSGSPLGRLPNGQQSRSQLSSQPNGQPNGQNGPLNSRLNPQPNPQSRLQPAQQPPQPGTPPQPAAPTRGRRVPGSRLGSRSEARPGPLGKRLLPRDRSSQQARSEQTVRRRTSPLVHICRLLILGVGVGAIVGTVIAVSNPAMRSPAVAKQGGDPTAQPPNLANRSGAPGTLATVSSVRMGREMTDLVAKVTPLTRDLTDLVPGVFLIDLDNGNFLSFNGSTAFSSASMIKLPILIAFFQDVDSGKVKLDEMLSMQQSDVAEGSGDMQYSGAGTQFTALDTATNMIIHSDNTATNMIIRRLGGNEAINQRFRQWGLQQTLLRKPLPDLEGLNTTSPKELVSLLALLNEGKLISMKSRDRTFDIMRRTVTDTLLPSVVAPGSTVAHKTGDIGSLVGDVGVVDLPSGRRYAIAAMVKRPHNDGRAQELIRQIAAVVYEHFGGQPMVVPSPVASPPAQAAPQTGTPTPGTQPAIPGAATSPTAPASPGLPGAAAPQAPGVQSPVPSVVAPGAAPGTAPIAPLTAPAPALSPTPEASPEAVVPEPEQPEQPEPVEEPEGDPNAQADVESDEAATW